MTTPTNYYGVTVQSEPAGVQGATDYWLCCEYCMGAEYHNHLEPSQKDIDRFVASHRLTCGR
jgi:hypothetical protein